MITGDIKETAQAIAKELGIITDEQFLTKSFSGNEFELLPPYKKSEILHQLQKEVGGLVISRSEPKHKRHLVQELRNMVFNLSYLDD